jgi:hypothetical protein
MGVTAMTTDDDRNVYKVLLRRLNKLDDRQDYNEELVSYAELVLKRVGSLKMHVVALEEDTSIGEDKHALRSHLYALMSKIAKNPKQSKASESMVRLAMSLVEITLQDLEVRPEEAIPYMVVALKLHESGEVQISRSKRLLRIKSTPKFEKAAGVKIDLCLTDEDRCPPVLWQLGGGAQE